MSASAVAIATAPGTSTVPARRPRSWPPPSTIGWSATPSRTTSAPIPFGPPNLCAEIETSDAPAAAAATSSHGTAWTASVCSTAAGARSRTSAATASSGWIVPTLVVDEHDRDDRRVVGERVGERVEVDDAVPRRGHPPHREPLALEAVGRGQHRLVLEPARDHAGPAARVPRGPRRPDDPQVVGLGAAPGEDDLPGGRPELSGDRLPGLLEGVLGDPGGRVGTGGVGEPVGEEGQHRRDGLGPHRRARGMVQVDGMVEGDGRLRLVGHGVQCKDGRERDPGAGAFTRRNDCHTPRG